MGADLVSTQPLQAEAAPVGSHCRADQTCCRQSFRPHPEPPSGVNRIQCLGDIAMSESPRCFYALRSGLLVATQSPDGEQALYALVVPHPVTLEVRKLDRPTLHIAEQLRQLL